MAELDIKNVTVSIKGNEILTNADFRMVDRDKIGIVGRNGCGKTTFFKFVIGEYEKDYNADGSIGTIVKSSDFKCGYLNQILNDKNITVYEYLLDAYKYILDMKVSIDKLNEEIANEYDEKKVIKLNSLIDTFTYEGGHYFEKELKGGFVKFGFELSDLDKKLSEFSGGQITKISLLKLLLSKPNVLLLDEPTNHLDIEAIEWMEDYLSNYKKNVLVISHDRMFLDNVCNVIYEIEYSKLTRYVGNYSDFLEQKDINTKLAKAKYEKNQKEIERLTALTERFRYKATKAKMVKSKDKIIDKLKKDTIEVGKADTKAFSYRIIPTSQGGREVLLCKNLVIGYDKNKPLNTIDLKVVRHDRYAIMGKNGTGKSTLLKTIIGKLDKISGTLNFGFDIHYEYFDQDIVMLDSDDTLMDDFRKDYPSFTDFDVRSRLSRFLFKDDDVNKKIKDLSGGEKVRFAFAKMFEKRPNLLILDEPTNHLDIIGKESLEDVINNYDGTVIFVSHDRYFTKKIANKVLYLEDGHTENFEYSYDEFEEYEKTRKENEKLKKDFNEISKINLKDYFPNDEDFVDYDKIEKDKQRKIEELGITETELNSEDAIACGKDAYIKQKEKAKNEKKILKIEEKIQNIENEIIKLNTEYEEMSKTNDFEKLVVISSDIEKKNKDIEILMEEWEELQGK